MDQENSSTSSFEDLTHLNDNEIQEAKEQGLIAEDTQDKDSTKGDDSFMDILGNGQLTKQVTSRSIYWDVLIPCVPVIDPREGPGGDASDAPGLVQSVVCGQAGRRDGGGGGQRHGAASGRQ